jgi:hypothetical protein
MTVVALLGAAMVAAVYGNPSFGTGMGQVNTTPEQRVEPPPRTVDPETPQPLPGAEQTGSALPAWVGYLLLTLCLLAVLALVIALLWMVLRDRLSVRRTAALVADPEQIRREAQERIRAAVDEGLLDLDIEDQDPRRAVIACWVRLEAAAAAAGTPREPGDTSTELVERLLAEHAITPSMLAGFGAVYREARFGTTHVVDATMREQARAALRQVRDELIHGASTDSAVVA